MYECEQGDPLQDSQSNFALMVCLPLRNTKLCDGSDIYLAHLLASINWINHSVHVNCYFSEQC